MKIVIKKASGGVAVMTLLPPAPPMIDETVVVDGNETTVQRAMTPAELAYWQNMFLSDVLRKWSDANPGLYVSYREMPDEAIPTDRTFRDAWDDVTPEPVIDIDMEKARKIHLDRIRKSRNDLLDENDKYLARAIDHGNEESIASIRAWKQELRDLPQTIQPQIDAASTIDELKAIQPLA